MSSSEHTLVFAMQIHFPLSIISCLTNLHSQDTNLQKTNMKISANTHMFDTKQLDLLFTYLQWGCKVYHTTIFCGCKYAEVTLSALLM